MRIRSLGGVDGALMAEKQMKKEHSKMVRAGLAKAENNRRSEFMSRVKQVLTAGAIAKPPAGAIESAGQRRKVCSH